MMVQESKVSLVSLNFTEFNEIINDLNGRLEEHKEKARKLIEGSKQVTKKDQVEHLKKEAVE